LTRINRCESLNGLAEHDEAEPSRGGIEIMRRDQRGVTLIEIAVILVVLSILLAAVFPSLGNILKVIASKGASEEVAGAIRLARQYAITQGSNHCVLFAGPPGTTYTINRTPSASNCTAAGFAKVEGPVEITQGLAIVQLVDGVGNPAGNAIIFSPIGNVANFSPSNPSVTAGVDTDPPSCLSSVLVTVYGGVRVSRSC
jgi:Tfp pilus assembly protein FimT